MKQFKRTHGMRSDVGRVRRSNEDSCFANDEMGLFAVADGMGGHAGGLIASDSAINALVDYVSHYMQDPDITPPFGLAMDFSGPENVLRAAMIVANARVFERGRRDKSLEGMGTTLSVSWIRGHSIHIGHVGDSRIYLIRDGSMILLTHDHSWVYEQYQEGVLTYEDTKNHPMRHLVTRSLGTRRVINADLHSHSLRNDDMIFLCTDGLTGSIPEEDILSAILEPALADLDEKCDVLVEMANQAGGVDNTTVLLVHVEEA